MKMNLTTIAVSIGLILTASQTTAANQQVVDVDDLKNNSSKTNKCSGLDCLLRMGTFSSQKYATRYKENLATKTNQPVKVEQDKNNKNLFHVIVGPFHDFAKMLQTSSELSGKPVKAADTTTKKAATQTPVVTNNSATKTSGSTLGISKPFMAVADLFKFHHHNNNESVNTAKYSNKKRTIAMPTTNNNTMTQHSTMTKHQQILASQSDYPIHQKPKTDAQGNVIPLFKTGPYVGASGGMVEDIGRNPVTAGYQGFTGTVSAGAGHMFTHRVYMGGEFYYGDTITAKNYSVGANGYSISSSMFYGGDFIPGYMITDTVLAYLRIGGMRAQFNAKPSAPIGSYIPGSTLSQRITLITNGWQVGGGAQTNLYKNLDARAEYVFSHFKGLAFNKVGRGTMSQVNVGLVYKFGDYFHKV